MKFRVFGFIWSDKLAHARGADVTGTRNLHGCTCSSGAEVEANGHRAPTELHAAHGSHGGAATNTLATEDSLRLHRGAGQHQDLTKNASEQSVMARTGQIGAAVRKNERTRRREPADTAARSNVTSRGKSEPSSRRASRCQREYKTRNRRVIVQPEAAARTLRWSQRPWLRGRARRET